MTSIGDPSQPPRPELSEAAIKVGIVYLEAVAITPRGKRRGMGMGMLEAFIAISVKPSSTTDLKKVFPENERVKEVFYVTGEFDFLLRVEAANTFELARIIESLRSQEGVENTVTFIVLEKLK